MEFRVLGPLEVVQDGSVLRLGSRKQRALLALLLVHAGEAVSRDRLIEELWRGAPPPSAEAALRSYVSRLRSVVGDNRLRRQAAGYALALDQDELDTSLFEQRLKDGRDALRRGRAVEGAAQLREALALWRGPALADFLDEPFAAPEANRLAELRLQALEERIEADLQLGRHADLVGELETLVGEHPLRERLWAQLMLGLYRCDRRAEALACYTRAREMLTEQLGLEPGERLRELQRGILRGGVPDLPVRGNLPAQLTSFVGRQSELAELAELLEEERLVTLAGVGGSGKTRLAVELAASLGSKFNAGVWMVEFASLGDPELVTKAVAETVAVREAPPRPLLELVYEELRQAKMLLVLDNCEHLLEPIASLGRDLLQNCAALHIVATSREPLGVTGEVIYQVAPLPVPEPNAAPETAKESPSVRLFLDRATAVKRTAVPEVAPVVRICRELDGLPLAIELAAARMAALNADEIAERLNDRFRFLRYWRRAVHARHQTLQAAIDWSYALLGEEERRFLRLLAVFGGGFTIKSAAAVCSSGDETGAFEATDRLVFASLVLADPRDGETRYRLLETVRQYAADRLAEAGETDAAHRRHAHALLDLARTTRDRKLAVELDNLRVALGWSFASGDPVFQQLVLALGSFWFTHGLLQEGRTWLERALSWTESEHVRAELRGLLGEILAGSGELRLAERLLFEASEIAEADGDDGLAAKLRVRRTDVQLRLLDIGSVEAHDAVTDAVRILESLEEHEGLAEAYLLLGTLLYWRDQVPAAVDTLERSRAFARETGNRSLELHAVHWLAATLLTLPIPVDSASSRIEQLFDSIIGEPHFEAWFLVQQGWLLALSGRLDEAREVLASGRRQLAEFGSIYAWTTATISSSLALLRGDVVAAEHDLRESYVRLRGAGEKAYLVSVAAHLAEALYQQERDAEAREMIEEVEAIADPDDIQPQTLSRTTLAKLLAREGSLYEAQRVAEDAVELVANSTQVLLRGRALLAKGHVLTAAGKRTEAAAAIQEALGLYAEKRVLVLADRARDLLAELTA